jgi:hypothetical protein
MGVKKAEELPPTRNRGCGALHRRRSSVQFRPFHGPGSRVKSLGSSLAPRRSDGGGWPGLGCGGAAGPRWGRGSARRSERAVALGFGWRSRCRG